MEQRKRQCSGTSGGLDKELRRTEGSLLSTPTSPGALSRSTGKSRVRAPTPIYWSADGPLQVARVWCPDLLGTTVAQPFTPRTQPSVHAITNAGTCSSHRHPAMGRCRRVGRRPHRLRCRRPAVQPRPAARPVTPGHRRPLRRAPPWCVPGMASQAWGMSRRHSAAAPRACRAGKRAAACSRPAGLAHAAVRPHHPTATRFAALAEAVDVVSQPKIQIMQACRGEGAAAAAVDGEGAAQQGRIGGWLQTGGKQPLPVHLFPLTPPPPPPPPPPRPVRSRCSGTLEGTFGSGGRP